MLLQVCLTRTPVFRKLFDFMSNRFGIIEHYLQRHDFAVLLLLIKLMDQQTVFTFRFMLWPLLERSFRHFLNSL